MTYVNHKEVMQLYSEGYEKVYKYIPDLIKESEYILQILQDLLVYAYKEPIELENLYNTVFGRRIFSLLTLKHQEDPLFLNERIRYYLVSKQDIEYIPIRVSGWVNVYGSEIPSISKLYPSQEEADENASPHRIACIRLTGESNGSTDSNTHFKFRS